MPVIDHEIHASVINTGQPYGCENRTHAAGYYMGTTFILNRMSQECRYDMSLNDPRCGNCQHRGSGEEYAAKIRENGN